MSCPRAELIQALAAFSLSRAAALIPAPEHPARALNREFEDGLVFSVLHRAAVKLFFPAWARAALTVLRSLRYFWAGLRALCRGRLSVSVLDATAIAVSLLRRDFNTAGSVMFLLRIGEMLEDWTHKKSVSSRRAARSKTETGRKDSRRGIPGRTGGLNRVFQNAMLLYTSRALLRRIKSLPQKGSLFNFLLVIAPKKRPFRKQVDKI